MSDKSTDSTRSRPTVLVVDDALSTRSILEEFFQRSGYNVLQATDPETAFKRLKTSDVDAIILDVRLADNRSGLEVLERVRLDERFADLLVIVLTGIRRLEASEEELIRRHRAHLLYKGAGYQEVLVQLDRIIRSAGGRGEPRAVATETSRPVAARSRLVH